MEEGKLSIHNKILAFSAVTGSCGGLFVGVADRLSDNITIIGSSLRFVSALLVGMLIGILAERTYKTNKNIFLKKDSNGNFDFFQQRIFLLPLFAAAADWFLEKGLAAEPRIIMAVMVSVVFFIGIACGMYGQFGYSTGRMLLAGLIPLFCGVIFFIIETPYEIRFLIPVLAFIYLLCSFIFMNNMQLRSNVFMTKGINIKSVRKIRRRNFLMVAFLSVICALFILISRILILARDVILKILGTIYGMLVKFSEWITSDPSSEAIGDPMDENVIPFKISDYPFEFVRVLLVIAAIIITAALVLLVIAIIKKGSQGRRAFYINDNEEYLEESEIIKDRTREKPGKKFRYTKKGLVKIDDPGKRIRYLYGFIIERLYKQKIKIKPSNTTGEIAASAIASEGGGKLSDVGFRELTDTYKKVRYGEKNVRLKTDAVEMADTYEKIISGMSP